MPDNLIRKIAAAAVLCGALAACQRSPQPDDASSARAMLTPGIDCSTAPQDIAVLEREHASVTGQMMRGTRSVFPASGAAAILTGDYNDRVKVAIGRYRDDVQDKMDEIRNSCGIQ